MVKTMLHVPRKTSRLGEFLEQRFLALPSWVVLIQLFIGLGWLRAAAEKAIEPDWWRGGVIQEFISQHEGEALGWFEPFPTHVVRPNVLLVAFVVLLAQLGAAMSLLTGRNLKGGLVGGVLMNLAFMASGAVNPSVFYLVSQGALLVWMAENARSSADDIVYSAVQVVAATVALVSIGFISTIHPAEVIDDPAVIFTFMGVLTIVVSELARQRSTAIDLRRIAAARSRDSERLAPGG